MENIQDVFAIVSILSSTTLMVLSAVFYFQAKDSLKRSAALDWQVEKEIKKLQKIKKSTTKLLNKCSKYFQLKDQDTLKF